MADSPGMNGATKQHGAGWRNGRRALLGLCGVVLFLGVASVIKPSPRGASAVPGNDLADDSLMIRYAFDHAAEVHAKDSGERALAERLNARKTTDAVHPKGWKLIGTLEGREHILRCWATADGPRYSVHTLDGRLIQDELPADEVYRGFPDLDLSNLRADPPQDRGMLVDFVDVWRE